MSLRTRIKITKEFISSKNIQIVDIYYNNGEIIIFVDYNIDGLKHSNPFLESISVVSIDDVRYINYLIKQRDDNINQIIEKQHS